MVGLKSFWIIISTLFVLAACVPQTKQTECGSNEAFNASLRTCVPIVGGPSSFINIATYTPMFTQSRSKDDYSTLNFSITVSNPYNQSYSVEWERVFNASPVTICSNSLSCSFTAASLGLVLGEVGTHIITAKLKDGNGTVTDTHSFELKIDDFPKPVIGIPITPSTYAFDKLPSDPRVQFSLVIKNNGAMINGASDNYRTIWTVQKNGSTIYTESDSFTNYASTGTNSAYLGISPTPWFNPGGATMGVGSYVVRAVVQNDVPGEIVAEQQWSVIVKQPDLANITTISLPAPGVTITNHNNVDYNDYPALSWIYGSPVNQPKYCITVDDADGTYASDGKAIQVKWYLDSVGGEICQKTTNDIPGSQTICLVDGATLCDGSGAIFDTSLLKFSNTTSTVAQNHKVTARLFDEASGYEFAASDVTASSGSYPIEWLHLTKPVNTAPVLAFSTTQPTGCSSAGTYVKANCQVTQGTSFNVTFTMADDFYSTLTDSEQFQYELVLKRNGSNITSPPTVTSCSKALTVNDDRSVYTCGITVPHFDATGPLHPTSASYSLVLNAQDSGSPVGGSAQSSTALTWNLVVSEANAGIAVNAQTTLDADSNISKGGTAVNYLVDFVTELDTIVFNLRVTDAEVDDFKHRISICTDNSPACTTSTPLNSYTTYTRSTQTFPDLNPTNVAALSYQIPEDFWMSKHSSSIDMDTVTNRSAYFKVEVQDIPQIATTTPVLASQVFQVYVRNYNPAPVINSATASPATGTTTKVYSGFPFTIDPGTVSDASVPAAEKNLTYKWYASTSGAGVWTEITGANTRVLTYTPGNTDTNIDLKMCVGDGTLANPVSSTGTCSAIWTIDPEPYAYNLTASGISTGISNEVAVWYDDTNTVPNTEVIYSAYVDAAKNILVEKTVKTTTGTITTSNVQTISFTGLATGAANNVTNLSITGTDKSLYIAYLASSTTAPSIMRPRLRRISKEFNTGGSPNYKAGLAHAAPFGFSYDNYTIGCTAGTCAVTYSTGTGVPHKIQVLTTLAVGNTVTINGTPITAANPGTGNDQVCASGTCATVGETTIRLAAAINNSTTYGIQGITAVVTATDEISLYGKLPGDYIEFNGVVGTSLIALSGGMSKIFIAGGKWYIPFINTTSSENYVNVLSGTVDAHLQSFAATTSDDLEEMGKVSVFDAQVNQVGQLVIAKISAEPGTAGQVSLYRYDISASPFTPVAVAGTERNNMQIFGTYDFEYVRIATDKASNPYYYVIGKEESSGTGAFHIGRYDPELDSAVTLLEYTATSKVSTADSTATYITNTRMKVPEIVSIPGYSEARIFFHSVGAGATPFPRVARWKADNTLACGTCASLSGTYAYQSTARIGISQVFNDRTFGTAGSIVGQNIRDGVFILMASDVATSGNYMPQLGLINTQSEVIQSTAVDGSNLFRPPFVLDQ